MQNNTHWVLSAINLKNKTFEHYDSMGGVDRDSLNSLKKWLVDEAKDKKQECVSFFCMLNNYSLF
jgi:sentrin-specific protease 1